VKQIPSVKAVMTPFPHHVDAERPLEEARRMMEQHRIRHLPVIRGDRLAGVVSDNDIRLASGPALTPATSGTLRVGDVIGHEAYVVELTEPLDVVALHMARERIEAALVVKAGRLVGIFTMSDACRELGEMLRTLFPRGTGDDAA
jgi:acetoin utilization protein AcuB